MHDIQILDVDFNGFEEFLRQAGSLLPDVFRSDSLLKFVLVGQSLIIGNVSDHTMLHILATFGKTKALATWMNSPKVSTFDDWRAEHKLGSTVLAAGALDRTGTVTSWSSFGISITTPMELRDPLQQLIQQHVQAKRQMLQSAQG